MPAHLKEIDQHNHLVYVNAFKVGDVKSMHDMAVEIEDLIAKHDGRYIPRYLIPLENIRKNAT